MAEPASSRRRIRTGCPCGLLGLPSPERRRLPANEVLSPEQVNVAAAAGSRVAWRGASWQAGFCALPLPCHACPATVWARQRVCKSSSFACVSLGSGGDIYAKACFLRAGGATARQGLKVLVLSAAVSELKWRHRLRHQGQLETYNSFHCTFCGQRSHHHQDRLRPTVWCCRQSCQN